MYTKTIKYEDYNGNEQSMTCHFNLNRLDLIDLQLSKGNEGLENFVKRVQETEDQAAAVSFIKELIDRSYGVKSVDGQRFEKSASALSDFKSTPAYDELFSSLLDPKNMEEFLMNAIPKKLQDELAKAQSPNASALIAEALAKQNQ